VDNPFLPPPASSAGEIDADAVAILTDPPGNTVGLVKRM
jgi:hypothetical protein